MAVSDLSLRHLATIAAIVDLGSYRAAGAHLGYSTGAVTAQVARVEAALGEAIFVRRGGPRSVLLTPAGRELYAAAREILACSDRLEASLAALGEEGGPRLAIGTFQTVSATLLPAVLAAVLARSPGLVPEVTESDDNERLTDALRRGELDATFVVEPVPREGIIVRAVCQDPFVAVVAANDHRTGPVSLAELAGQQLIGHNGCACHRLVERSFAEAGLSPSFVFRSNDNRAVQAMVRAGIGTAIMPRLSLDPTDPLIRLLPISPALPERSIALALPATRPSPVALQFAEAVQELAPTVLAARHTVSS